MNCIIEEKLYFNAINKVYKPYQPTIIKLYQKLVSFKRVFNALNIKERVDIEKEYEKLEKLGVEIVVYDEESYSLKLKNIDEPPLGLYVLGNKSLLNDESLSIAIVGTRKATNYGLLVSHKFSKELASLGITIISGLAYGIDESAHKGAIEDNGKTIAVLGEGIDLALSSPRGKLIEKIIENDGAIISEYSLSTPAMPYHFPLRNRIIAGLSDGILVIEAPIDSGALITANYGLKYGKEIFVVPGEITNKNFQGSHNLIKQGAKITTEIEDILIEFNFDINLKDKLKRIKLSPKEEIIYEILEKENKSIEELKLETNLSIQELLIILTNMEVKGIIKNKGGKFYLNQ